MSLRYRLSGVSKRGRGTKLLTLGALILLLTGFPGAISSADNPEATPNPYESQRTAADTLSCAVAPRVTLENTVYSGHEAEKGKSCPGQETVPGVIGDSVTYCFWLGKTDDTYLTGINVTDVDFQITHEGMDTTPRKGNTDNPTRPGLMLASYPETIIGGSLKNPGSVSAQPSDRDGNPSSGLQQISASDTAAVRVAAKADIKIDKTVYDGHDAGASCSSGKELVKGLIGTRITYCFLVENTGNTHLGGFRLADQDLKITTEQVEILPGGDPIDPLKPGGRVALYYEHSIQNDLTNTVEISANPTDKDGKDLPGMADVTSQDTASVEVEVADYQAYLPMAEKQYPLVPVVNGGFEAGSITGWKVEGDDVLPAPRVVRGGAAEGTYSLLLGDPPACNADRPDREGDHFSKASQNIYVPDQAGTPILRFQYRIVTFDHMTWTNGTTMGDSLDVFVDGQLALRDNFENYPDPSPGCTERKDSNWKTSDKPWFQEGEGETTLGEVDLTKLNLQEKKGQHVEVRFELVTRVDGYYNTWAFLDDVKVEMVEE